MAKTAAAPAAAKKAPTKTEIMAAIAQATEANKKLVQAVLEALAGEIKKALRPRGGQVFHDPRSGEDRTGRRSSRPSPARKGVPNPFKPGELMDVPAKAASTKVKVRALKNLKTFV